MSGKSRLGRRQGLTPRKEVTWHGINSRFIFGSQLFDGLMTILHERGITPLLFEKPRAEMVTGSKDARVRERWRGECVAAEEKEGDGDGEETSEDHEEMAGRHGGLQVIREKRGLV